MKSLVEAVKNIGQEDTTIGEDEFTEIIHPKQSSASKPAKKFALSTVGFLSLFIL